MTDEILDHYVTDTDVERMADDLAIDEMHNINFGDLPFVLKKLLRDKYRSMIPTDLLRLHRERFYYSYSEEIKNEM